MFEITPGDILAARALATAMDVAFIRNRAVYRNRTLGEFISACHALGIKDDDTLGSVEIGISQYGTGYVHAEKDEYGAWEVREVQR